MNVTISRIVSLAASVLLLLAATPGAAQADPQEARYGAAIYNYLKSNGILIERSPLYDILTPITTPIKTVADPRYDAPFVFTIGHDPYPNVAAVPGGRVYVSDKTFGFLQYRDELAGALCHAVAHTIRHDEAKLAQAYTNNQLGSALIGVLFLSSVNPAGWFSGDFSGLQNLQGANDAVNAANVASAVGNVATLAAAAAAEQSADTMGADICAQAGFNPWGLVWLFQNYQKSKVGGRMEMLPSDPAARIKNLEAHFAADPAKFGGFDPDRAHGAPLR